ncbi:hypothetical protein ANCDUO_07679 [Ancylostoma duodenale]|uniref:7TM GPCR serpentine receptor class x (Srx) domain-containing protein n=1 Tax=Ancylostoma duodenale TaxID=51022 RepID=A0A0C2GSR6_9BILA|nr:hypothetical protein ANCDUO_07679 [Ancylostoma duodenale]
MVFTDERHLSKIYCANMLVIVDTLFNVVVSIFLTHQCIVLTDYKDTVSEHTQRLQRKFMKALIAQVSFPFVFAAIPGATAGWLVYFASPHSQGRKTC